MEELDPLYEVSGHMINEKKMKPNHKEGEKQRLTRRQAEAENFAKSSFLAHMSHEIRTPLTGLLGMLELINKERLDEDDLNYLQTAHGSGLALLSLLNDILDTSKVEAGQLKLETLKFNPTVVAQEVVQLLSLDAQKKGIDLKLTTHSQIPLYLMGDPTRLRQVFFNLAGNAVKFTSKGGVDISLGGTYDDNHFTLAGEVVDTGIGMSAETQERLFKSFSQADTSMLRRFGGTGLGLFITKKLCEMMEWDISVSSEVGKGSTFRFHIRLGRSKDLIPQTQSSSSTKLPEKLPNIKILVAEDNAVNQLILKTMLTKAGCSVTTVWNGQEALEAITHNHYDLVLMDGEMPVMDGLEATQKIRETFLPKALPIIGVTAHAMVEDREKFLNAGMNGYLTKPVQREALYTEILKCMPFVTSSKS